MAVTPFSPSGYGLTPVLQNTTAENLDPSLQQPYDSLSGGQDGTPSAKITVGNNIVFPQTNGVNAVLLGPNAKPGGFSLSPANLILTGPDPTNNFAIWPTIFQRAYILAQDPNGLPPSVAIGGSNFQVIDNSGRVTRDGTLLQYSTGAATLPIAYNTVPGSLDLNSPDSGVNFLKWHSSFQVEYLLKNQTSGNPPTLVIGSGADARTIFLADDNTKIFIVENLQKADIGKMGKADQTALVGIAAFQAVASRLGLTTAVSTLQKVITKGQDKVNASNNLTADQKQIFVSELQNVSTRLNSGAVGSIKDVNDAVSDIMKRFATLDAYGAVANGAVGQPQALGGDHTFGKTINGVFEIQTIGQDLTQKFNVISSVGNNDAIVAGFRKMLAQEQQILNVDNARLNVATSAGGGQKQLDAPNLVFLFQLEYNLKDEAKLTFQTEEVNQQNFLLQSYGKMQQIVNQTIAQFGNSDSKQKLGLLGLSNLNQVPADDKAAINMFEDRLGTGSPAKVNGEHPFELLNGISRPLFDMIDNGDNKTLTFHFSDGSTQDTTGNFNDNGGLNQFLQSQWSTFGTQLSDAISSINQQTQIAMNDINSLTKQKDRHFDLANNALAKAAEVAQSIGRNLN